MPCRTRPEPSVWPISVDSKRMGSTCRHPSRVTCHVRGKIWELRPEWSGHEYRFFYGAIVGQRFVILHAIHKKAQKLRERDIATAEQRYDDIKKREAP